MPTQSEVLDLIAKQAEAVAVEKFADCGPGKWWFVHHPDGFLIEAGTQAKAHQIASEINAGRAALRVLSSQETDNAK